MDPAPGRAVSAGAEPAVQRALERAAGWRLVAAAFAYPTETRLAAAAAEAVRVARAEHPSAVRDALEAFAAAAGTADAEAVAGEHVFLFDRQVPCPPYEGAWGDGPRPADRPVLLADVGGFYRAFGLEPAGAEPDSEDHLVAEAEFMSALAIKEAWALAEGLTDAVSVVREAQRAFLRDHLGRWAGAFAEALARTTPLTYYTAAAALLTAWVDAEAAGLGADPARVAARAPVDPVAGAEVFGCPAGSCLQPRGESPGA
jgi:DMSO reductase family type II enzyme chaperone